MQLVYSTSDVHPRDRMSYWVEVATKGFVRHEFSTPLGAAFTASVGVAPVAELGVASFTCDAAEVSHSALDIARGDSDQLLLCLSRSGRGQYTQDGRQAILEPGSFLLLDARRPFSLSFERPARTFTFKIPRDLLEARLGNVTALTARAISPTLPLAGLASGFLRMLADRADVLPDVAAQRVSEQALDLLALAYSMIADQRGLALSSARATALIRLKSAVDAGLCDPELKPAAAAAAAGLSVRYANALLSHEGSSLERYIQDRRLARCRRALDDPAQEGRTIGDIAFSWGFSDLSHFGRRFKAEYGLSPRDYRRRSKDLTFTGLPGSSGAEP